MRQYVRKMRRFNGLCNITFVMRRAKLAEKTLPHPPRESGWVLYGTPRAPRVTFAGKNSCREAPVNLRRSPTPVTGNTQITTTDIQGGGCTLESWRVCPEKCRRSYGKPGCGVSSQRGARAWWV